MGKGINKTFTEELKQDFERVLCPHCGGELRVIHDGSNEFLHNSLWCCNCNLYFTGSGKVYTSSSNGNIALARYRKSNE